MFLLLSTWPVCSVSYTANKYSIYHFCIIIKDFFIFFSRVIIVQGFETVTFYVLFVYTLIRVSWTASGNLLKFPLYDSNDYDDNWGRF